MPQYRGRIIVSGVFAIIAIALLTVIMFPKDLSFQQRQFSIFFTIILVVTELVLFFLPKKWIKGGQSNSSDTKKAFFDKSIPWNIALMIICVFLGWIIYMMGLGYYEPSGFDPFQSRADEIKSIIISPSGNKYTDLLDKPIYLNERKDIKLIVKVLNTATSIHPNHPGSQWDCDLTLKTENQDITINISDTKRNKHGVLVYWWSPNMRINLGERRCDKLGPLLEYYAMSNHQLNKLNNQLGFLRLKTKMPNKRMHSDRHSAALHGGR